MCDFDLNAANYQYYDNEYDDSDEYDSDDDVDDEYDYGDYGNDYDDEDFSGSGGNIPLKHLNRFHCSWKYSYCPLSWYTAGPLMMGFYIGTVRRGLDGVIFDHSARANVPVVMLHTVHFAGICVSTEGLNYALMLLSVSKSVTKWL